MVEALIPNVVPMLSQNVRKKVYFKTKICAFECAIGFPYSSFIR